MKTSDQLLVSVLVPNASWKRWFLLLLFFLKVELLILFTYCVNLLKSEENFLVALCDQIKLFVPFVLLRFSKILELHFMI